MGTWEGHISPGVAFYSFGILFCIQISREVLLKKKTQTKRSQFSLTCTKHNLLALLSSADGIMKIIYGVGAASAELFYPPGTNKLYMTYPNGGWAHLSEWQHFTMYISFAISGIVDVISQQMLRHRVVTMEKAAVAMAFYMTSLLLFYHRHGKSELEKESHELLLFAAMVMCITLTAEIWKPDDIKLKSIHTLAVMVMGSWLFHLAFILFPLHGTVWHDPNDPMNEMVLPIFFGWHILFNCFVASSIFTIQYFWIKSKSQRSCYDRLELEELKIDSEDDETEFCRTQIRR